MGEYWGDRDIKDLTVVFPEALVFGLFHKGVHGQVIPYHDARGEILGYNVKLATSLFFIVSILVFDVVYLVSICSYLNLELSLDLLKHLEAFKLSFSSFTELENFSSLSMAPPSHLLALTNNTIFLALVEAWLSFSIELY